MIIKKMEVEEKVSPVIDDPNENNSKKEKIITLLFPPKSQSIEWRESKKDKNKLPTKVIIRRLPPKLTKEAFIEEFSPLPAHDYFYFVRGDLNLGVHAFSRAYINFLNQDDIFTFKEKYDDYDLQDDKGRIYHAVVEFAALQKIPKRNLVKKKLSKAGTLESDPKYIEFLQKLEESKNFINNPSEYFHETDNLSLKTKVVTTPLLEFLKKKRQKKIDLRNEIRQRKREAEREKKRKEEEKRKAEREKRKEEKKILDKNKDEKRDKIDIVWRERKAEREKQKEEKKNVDKNKEEKQDKVDVIWKERKNNDDKCLVKEEIDIIWRERKNNDDKGHVKEEKKDSKNKKNLEKELVPEGKVYSNIPNDPAILEVVIRRYDKESKLGAKNVSKINDDSKGVKSHENDNLVDKLDKKHSDFRTKMVEEKQKKSFYKREPVEESKVLKLGMGNRKGIPDEKGDNYHIGSCGDLKEAAKKIDSESEVKRNDFKVDIKETKSKFRYSEQRNRDREYRRKTSDVGNNARDGVGQISNAEKKNKGKELEDKGSVSEVKKYGSEPLMNEEGKKSTGIVGNIDSDLVSLPGRRKSLEMERELMETERKRSKSFHDISTKELEEFRKKNSKDYQENDHKTSALAEESMKDGTDEDLKKDPRTERRIRNKRMHPNYDCHPTCTYVKDRPSIEIYRPGMGKFSKQRLEHKKEDSNCTSPNGTPYFSKSNRFAHKTISKKNFSDGKNSFRGEEGVPNKSFSNNCSEGNGKHQNEVRTITFNRSTTGKEN